MKFSVALFAIMISVSLAFGQKATTSRPSVKAKTTATKTKVATTSKKGTANKGGTATRSTGLRTNETRRR